MKIIQWVMLLFCTINCVINAEEVNKKVDVTPFLPKNVEKRGPYINRSAENTFFEYFDKVSGKLLAKEFLHNGKTIRLNFVKAVTVDGIPDMVKDGVQLEWHENGQLKSESPFTDGVRNGLFKEWDEKGNLIARNKIINGTGTWRVYFSNGQLKEERSIRNNKNNGSLYEYFKSGQIENIASFKDGKCIGSGYIFIENGQFRDWYAGNDAGELHGPTVHFAAQEKPNEVKYRVHNIDVKEEDYIIACQKDPSLPKYEKDTNNYLKFLKEEIRKLDDVHKNPPIVQIPLKDED